ncbi:HAD hydrolase-like protein [Serinibacter salmoneus]|uniref:Phosphoglycolate phosphatase n=1 Tax=Serinibacter salmoneus TaxID=556530 RepID=A0A2A9D007_9MICO|nr:HAD hydrolase-like protein [Serinibacter salmoneus]PFG19282.1 phosphoglycolate phosphatase [Serinibacter salmoneus]
MSAAQASAQHPTPIPPPLVLLDLDGTLMDSAPGITASVIAAFERLGLPVPDEQGLRSFVGPPLPASMRAHGVPEERLTEAVTAYRAAFEAGGMWDSRVFAGVPEVLQQLRGAGYTLAIATSKPQVYARPICERYGLSDLVDGVYGAPLDHIPSSKATVIADALADLGPRVPTTERIVMVGDRHHDVEGSAEHGIACLGVDWGYADPGELAGAVAIVPAVADLLAAISAQVRPRVG